MSMLIRLIDEELGDVVGGTTDFITLANDKEHEANDHALNGLTTAEAAGGNIDVTGGKKK